MVLCQSMQKNMNQCSSQMRTINAQIIHTHWPKELKVFKKDQKINRPQENCIITKQLSTSNIQVLYIKYISQQRCVRHFNYRAILPIPLSHTPSHPNSQNALLGMSIMLRGQKFTDNHFHLEHGCENFYLNFRYCALSIRPSRSDTHCSTRCH